MSAAFFEGRVQMRSVWLGALAVLVSTFVLNHPLHAADQPSEVGCTSFEEFIHSDCPLTWHGITLYGTFDAGVTWVSHGMPQSPYNYEGQSLVNRNGNHPQFLIAPNNLSQSGVGIKARIEFMQDWFVVFNASTGINPQSGQLANLAATNIANNGLPRASYSFAGDGSRAGQTFNDEFQGGISSLQLGTLTFGRQRALGTDAMLAYDPAGGDTQDARWDNAIKYRITFDPVHFGAMYRFVNGSGGCFSASANWTAATCTGEQPHNNAYGFNFGGQIDKFAADV